MSFEIKKQERENAQSLVRRFSRRLKNSGILIRARSLRFRDRPKSDFTKRKAALRRIEKRAEYEHLSKLGLVEKNQRRGRR
ncbi:MAG: hypothetical protein KJI69_02200 [Patescibacteria group bacterium]|nr:hypothetical protein [Patescibacteria group bacterium]